MQVFGGDLPKGRRMIAKGRLLFASHAAAELAIAALTPTERAARRLELQAKLAAGAIPSRREEAETLRAEAAAVRAPAEQRAA